MRRVRKIYFEKAADVPNSRLPILICRSVLPLHTARKANTFRKRFKSAGWTGIWTDTIYDYTHFHSNAHGRRPATAPASRSTRFPCMGADLEFQYCQRNAYVPDEEIEWPYQGEQREAEARH
jgi:hypothetical protein